ncbi:T9SS type A sorting domain-containing protein [candidate division KSB1 bacterium]|nr:T9SS type A sorting domain-containing protein [candidate division KSB1 bacterium]
MTVGFAWLAGSELSQLQATADAAQAAWDDFIVSVEPLSSATVPRQFALDQNYPNPFNPATEISYSLPRPAEVWLEIFNLLGQKVRSLLQHEKQAAGRCTVFWDGRDDFGRSAASGIYLYRITAGDFIRTMKMTLLK